MKNRISDRMIRVGVLGADRGRSLAHSAALSGMELVAVCDHFKARLDAVCSDLHVAGYEDFDTFIRQDFDAVIVQFCFLFLNMFLMCFLPCGICFLISFFCLDF